MSATTEREFVVKTDAPAYITIKAAADALGMKLWPVAQLAEAGELRSVRFGALLLVSAHDVFRLATGVEAIA